MALTPIGFCIEATDRLWKARRTHSIELTSSEIETALLAVEQISKTLSETNEIKAQKIEVSKLIKEIKEEIDIVLGSVPEEERDEAIELIFNNAIAEVEGE